MQYNFLTQVGRLPLLPLQDDDLVVTVTMQHPDGQLALDLMVGRGDKNVSINDPNVAAFALARLVAAGEKIQVGDTFFIRVGDLGDANARVQ